ncbi:hypothetical protein FRC17_006853 [Serendipita sp. 399]|nr:hypothetical protein FRC17_006853 [Serendipita sp. 399]
MAEPRAPSDDQTRDQLQRHPDLYLEDGTLVIQVESTIFKVHRSVLVRYSTVLRDMLDVPSGKAQDGTDERPVCFAGESAVAWGLLLGSQYELPLIASKEYNGEQLLSMLSVAHKYCMERIEAGIVAKLKMTSSYDGFVDMIVASQITDSNDLYEDGLQRLIASGSPPTLPQAIRMGVKATHTVMGAVMGESVASVRSEMITKLKELSNTYIRDLEDARNRTCQSCDGPYGWSCDKCGYYHD